MRLKGLIIFQRFNSSVVTPFQMVFSTRITFFLYYTEDGGRKLLLNFVNYPSTRRHIPVRFHSSLKTL